MRMYFISIDMVVVNWSKVKLNFILIHSSIRGLYMGMQPRPCEPDILAQLKHGPVLWSAGPGWHGPGQQAMPGLHPRHIGRHGMAR